MVESSVPLLRHWARPLQLFYEELLMALECAINIYTVGDPTRLHHLAGFSG